MVPVLNELGRRVPGLTAILRTTVAASFFRDRLTIPWQQQSVAQDVGCLQRGPLEIDVPATWDAYRQFHATWEDRLAVETTAMAAAAPLVVLADTPYLAVSAGTRTGVPSVVLANFMWSEVLTALDESASEHRELVGAIQRAYAEADVALRIAPALPMSGIKTAVDVGPIAQPAEPQREALRSALNIPASDRLVLVGFGGIPLQRLPWDGMEGINGYQFLVNGVPPRVCARVHSLEAVPFSFKTILASVDVLMTKPGYGTIVEAVALGLPVVYVRRHNFADEASLVEFLHRHGQGRELSRDDFDSGNWRPTLEALSSERRTAAAHLITGAVDAAQYLLRYFQ